MCCLYSGRPNVAVQPRAAKRLVQRATLTFKTKTFTLHAELVAYATFKEKKMTTYATEEIVKDEQQLEKTAVRSDLSADEGKRVLAGLGFLGIVAQSADFSHSNGLDFLTRSFGVRVPEGTLRIFTYLGDWNFFYGTNTYIERPLSHMWIKWRVNSFSQGIVSITVETLLRDINGDDPWGGRVEIITACFG